MRALIVDDEPLARRGIRVRLERATDVEVIGESPNGVEAVAAIQSLLPDLVFLDVQMPGLDGFGVVEQVGAERMPPVVFVTAYDAHALKAFDVHALDYLLKPIDDERFDVAIARARRRVHERAAMAERAAVGRQLAAVLAEVRDRRILIKDRGKVIIVSEADVDWVEAEGDYVRVHTGGRGHLLRETMAAMAERLDPARFARIHRSTIVNVSRIRELKPHPNREYTVVLHDGTRLKLSRGYRDALRGHFADEL
jgi:two-component system, LytTR family, response regulator